MPQSVNILKACAFCKKTDIGNSPMYATILACKDAGNGKLEPIEAYTAPICGACFEEKTAIIKNKRVIDKFVGILLTIVTPLLGVAAIYCFVLSNRYSIPIERRGTAFNFTPMEALLVLVACGLAGVCFAAGYTAWEKLCSGFAFTDILIKRTAEDAIIPIVKGKLGETHSALKVTGVESSKSEFI